MDAFYKCHFILVIACLYYLTTLGAVSIFHHLIFRVQFSERLMTSWEERFKLFTYYMRTGRKKYFTFYFTNEKWKLFVAVHGKAFYPAQNKWVSHEDKIVTSLSKIQWSNDENEVWNIVKEIHLKSRPGIKMEIE